MKGDVERRTDSLLIRLQSGTSKLWEYGSGEASLNQEEQFR
jgi:hypothetical protein